jgi:hypothetical protein
VGIFRRLIWTLSGARRENPIFFVPLAVAGAKAYGFFNLEHVFLWSENHSGRGGWLFSAVPTGLLVLHAVPRTGVLG